MSTIYKCADCGEELPPAQTGDEARLPCTSCGSSRRAVTVIAASGAAFAAGVAFAITGESVFITRPTFSFGAIVTPYERNLDGDIIKIIEPVYIQLVKLINNNDEYIYQIPPRKWEEMIAAAYDKAGFDEVILTPRSGDLGRDVIAKKYGFGSIKLIDQVKAYKPGHIVTADEVRSLLGVLQAEQNVSKAVFTTTSTFAPRIEDDRLIKPFCLLGLNLLTKKNSKLNYHTLYCLLMKNNRTRTRLCN